MSTAVCFLWHMHQPYYRNPVGGEYRMPWAFLHAAKDYYDMLRLAVDGGARVTFNLVPSLIDQLEDYALPGVADVFLDLVRVHPAELSAEARGDLLPRLFLAHLENQIRPLERYFALHEKARYHGRRAAEVLTDDEFLDLEVLFLLAWCGEVVRVEEPVVRGLLARGEGYRQEDKLALLDVLHRLAGRTVVEYRSAQEADQVELSTTPYYHPILPLLLDMGSAREALPKAPLPVIQRGFDGDAARQVAEAIGCYQRTFGRDPAGFWPSEGSVSAAALGLLADHGARWAATDEDILAASLGRELSGAARGELYRPHVFRSAEGREVAVYFRDKTLADLIGFTYATWDPAQAVRDFTGRLEALAAEHGSGATVSVILDGENAWEFYRRNGAPFLRGLYRAVAESPRLQFATFSERLGTGGGRVLPRVHAGSWIYGSFSTWVGHPEKNRAWELLERTRCLLTEEEGRLGQEERDLAWREILIAEGSDWFWWLGDDHYSPLAGEFDGLFRLHLLNVYRLMGREPPGDLNIPIKGGVRDGLLEPVVGEVIPTIDGSVSSYFEWLPAGLFDLGYDAGAMHRADRRLRRLRFGTGAGKLHLCVEGAGSLADLRGLGLRLEVEVLGSRALKVSFPLDGGPPEVAEGEAAAEDLAFAWGRVGELSLPLEALGIEAAGQAYAALRLLRDGEALERAPLYHMARLDLPRDHDLETWSA